MSRHWRELIGCLVLLSSVAGCQCCPLTDHYADAVDCIADHEHGLEALYCPCYDLTRIGRPDWCHCGVNRYLCQCRCARCKPLPHITDAAFVGVNCPWSEGATHQQKLPPAEATEPSKSPEPPQASPSDSTLQPVEDPPALRPNVDEGTEVPPGEESLDLPPEGDTDDASFRTDAAAELWSLGR